MKFSLARSHRGSALLMVVLLSGFMLVSFIAFSGIVRESIRSHSSDFVDQLIQVDQYREVYFHTGSGALPDGFFGDPSGPMQQSTRTVFSGSTQTIIWQKSGILNLEKSNGAPFCYTGQDGGSWVSGCITQTGSINLSANTGTLTLATLGGYSNVSITPSDHVTSSGAIFRIFRGVGNAVFVDRFLRP